jgi:hypothetical protein
MQAQIASEARLSSHFGDGIETRCIMPNGSVQ